MNQKGFSPIIIVMLIAVLFGGAFLFFRGGPPSNFSPDKTAKKVEPCPATTLQRAFNNTPYYSGPLIDDHFHMPQMFKVPEHPQAPVLDEDVSSHDVICLFSKGRVEKAFAFYGIPMHLKDKALKSAKAIEAQSPGTIIHFLEFVKFPGYPVDPKQIDQILNSNKGLFKGYGEISLYLPHYGGVSPNDPAMKELYKIAEKHSLPVMMHPLENQQQAVEEVLRDFPNVKFLFHAMERLSWANTFFDSDLDKYPNAYYSVDIDIFGQDSSGRPMLAAFSDKQSFTLGFKTGWEDTLNKKVAFWKSKIEKHPDQFLWGTDRGDAAWNYDSDIGALLEEYSRAFIGQLDPAVQEKYAYKNAEKLLQD